MPTNTLTGQDAAVDCAASRRNLGLWLFGAPPLWSRPVADVERSHSISICLEPAPNAPEVVEVSTVGFVHEPATWAGLRGVPCTYSLNDHTFLCGLVLKRKSQEAVGDSIDTLARPLSPLAPAFPQVLEALDGYPGVEAPRQLDQFPGELPASRAGVVSLSSAESLELLPGLASAVGVSMGLKPRSPSLELRLHPRQVLPEIELPQNLALGAVDGHGNAASVDVHPEHVRTFSLRWLVLSQDGEEPEVGLHDHRADLPASPEVGLEPMPGPILNDGQTHSLSIRANAQGRVAASRGLEAEEAAVEANDHVADPIGCLANPPSVAPGFLYKLGGHAEPLSILVVSQTVQFGAAFDFASFDQGEALLSHLEKGAVGAPELRPLGPGERERVERKTLLHSHQTYCAIRPHTIFGGREVTESIVIYITNPQLKRSSCGVLDEYRPNSPI